MASYTGPLPRSSQISVEPPARYYYGPTNSTATLPFFILDPGKQFRYNLEPGLTARSFEAPFQNGNNNQHVAPLNLLYTSKKDSNVSFSLLLLI